MSVTLMPRSGGEVYIESAVCVLNHPHDPERWGACIDAQGRPVAIFVRGNVAGWKITPNVTVPRVPSLDGITVHLVAGQKAIFSVPTRLGVDQTSFYVNNDESPPVVLGSFWLEAVTIVEPKNPERPPIGFPTMSDARIFVPSQSSSSNDTI